MIFIVNEQTLPIFILFLFKTIYTKQSVIRGYATPVSMALSKTDKDTNNKIKDEVINKVNEKFGKGKVNIPASTIVISGEK
jgi:hypothetical protein